MKIGNDTHPGRLFYSSFVTDLVPCLVHSLVPGLVNNLVNAVRKFMIRLRSCAG